MSLAVFTLMINASLTVLIWIVQLIVYPGFCYMTEANIKRWHPKYTLQITCVVLPLMISQLGVSSYCAVTQTNSITLITLALVLNTWLITFLVSVPLHAAIDQALDSTIARKKLVQTNWLRTILWTIILIISILCYGK